MDIINENDSKEEEMMDGGVDEVRRLYFPNARKVLLKFEEAPIYLQFNKFILEGYRCNLSVDMCIDSVFWMTNETINIWSHLFGVMVFLGLMIYDLFLLNFHSSLTDNCVVGGLLFSYQICMVLSASYHTFSCHSENFCFTFLKYDLLGIALSLLSVYLSGIYYAFWCYPVLCGVYLVSILSMFFVVLLIQILCHNQILKMVAFVAWVIYGLIPTIHWTYLMHGWENPIVQKLLPRIINMYLISSCAFSIYVTRIPERFFPGLFDYVGSSHQVWHVIVVIALYYWHNTGIYYIEYRMNHGCMTTHCPYY